MSLCDTCARPGRCCFGFELNGGSFGQYLTSIEMLAKLATIVVDRDRAHTAEVGMIGLPFMPWRQDCDGKWQFWCPNLGLDGRCTDYENRPGLCKDFEPASDPPCIYHKRQADKCDGCTPFRDRPINEKRQEQCHPKIE